MTQARCANIDHHLAGARVGFVELDKPQRLVRRDELPCLHVLTVSRWWADELDPGVNSGAVAQDSVMS
jgi:hypothetical protein